MHTFQDFEAAGQDKRDFILTAIEQHKQSRLYKTALVADLYDAQKNETINDYVQKIFTLSGTPVEDFTASNNKIASNFFHRLNTQRCTYSLGNGISFQDDNESIKDALGTEFDTDLYELSYRALIHGLCFGFWDSGKLHVFPITQFVPLWDEDTGAMRAGIRFWQLDSKKPLNVVLFELDGYTKFRRGRGEQKLVEVNPKRAYKLKIEHTEIGGDEIVGEENYSGLPVIPMWGSRLHQSTLIGMRSAIDSFDLIRSGFANDLTDCSQIYWIIENCGGMTDSDLAKFRDRLKINHIVEIPTGADANVTPYTQDIPYQARQAYLTDIRNGIYEDFGGLDVHAVNADSTNDHLEAAYQPMDENADDFEYQVIKFIQQLLKIAGLPDAIPQFKRNRISNQREQVEMLMMEANYLDEETILNKLPNITVDEVANIMKNRDMEDIQRISGLGFNGSEE